MKKTDFELIKRLIAKNLEAGTLIAENIKTATEIIDKANINGENLKPSQQAEILEDAQKFNDVFLSILNRSQGKIN